MSFLSKIKSIFSKKSTTEEILNKTDSVEKSTISTSPPPEKKITDEKKVNKTIHSVTEASLCRTSYGICKLKEDGNKRYLLFPKQMDVKYIPFIENDIIEAVYSIDPSKFEQDSNNRFIYEIMDSAQFFMLSKEQKAEISSELESRGIKYSFPPEIDNYSLVMNILRSSKVLMKNQDANWFEMNGFLSDIIEIKGSNTYKELQLVRLKDGRRFILIINQIIPNVVEYGPAFMNIYEPGAVKITYQEGYAFIAPLGKPK